MHISRFVVAILLVTFAVVPRASSAADADVEEILEGVDTTAMPGVVGSLAVFGEEAFPVVVAPTKEGSNLPLIAAAHWKKGRIICGGHGGYLSPGAAEKGETGRLMSNMILWAADLTEKQAGRLKVAVVNNKALADALNKAGVQAAHVKPDQLNSVLSKANVLLVSPRTLSAADVPRIARYVQGGGGLVMADAGWVWESYDAKPGERLASDFVGNQIAVQAGIVWTTTNFPSPKGETLTIHKELNESCHAIAALTYLEQQPDVPPIGQELKQAVAVLENVVASVPSDDTLFLPKLQALTSKRLPKLVIPTVNKPVKDEQVFARLQVALETQRLTNLPVDQLQPHPYATAFPGEPPTSAKTISKSLDIDTVHPKWHSTGLFAPAGQEILITVPAAVAKGRLSVRIGPQKDRLWHLDKWQRPPEVTRNFSLTKPRTTVGSALGGLIYIDVPKDCPLGKVQIEIEGAIAAPLFVHDETTDEQWRSIRDAAAPWGELASDRLILTVPSDVLRQLDNPQELMDFWNNVLDACADLATTPRNRAYPERFVCDAQISAGYMHAGYPIMAPIRPLAKEVTDLATLKSKGNWGVYHEIGHNHQEPEWTWDGLTEVTVNLFSMYVYDHINPGADKHKAISPPNLLKMTAEFEKQGKLSGAFEQLMPYIQLQREFGWEPFQKVFAEYRALSKDQRPKSLQERKDQWLIRFSRTVGRNLGPFYDYWKIGMSAEARQQVSQLPSWMPDR